jgi:hypothetical protein
MIIRAGHIVDTHVNSEALIEYWLNNVIRGDLRPAPVVVHADLYDLITSASIPGRARRGVYLARVVTIGAGVPIIGPA